MKPELVKGVDLVIVRELIGGIYFGDKCESEQHNGAERAWDLENYSVPEVDRIAKLAFETAKLRRGKVTSVDKANVLATSRLWRRTVAKIAESYPDVELNNLYVDNCAMQLAIRPTQFDVIVTGNLFGDILSDEAAVVGGSIGMMPSASIGTSTSLYEQSTAVRRTSPARASPIRWARSSRRPCCCATRCMRKRRPRQSRRQSTRRWPTVTARRTSGRKASRRPIRKRSRRSSASASDTAERQQRRQKGEAR